MTIKEYSKDFSNIFQPDITNFSFPTIEEIYKKSILSWDDLYKSLAIVTVESNNSFKECEDMEFFKYISISKYISEYIEEKMKRENGEGGDSANVNEQSQSLMNNAKTSMSGFKNNFKSPSLSNYKIK